MKLRKAVLLIHGFAGGTYDMESIAWRLQRCLMLDVYQFTLPGHGYKAKELSNYKEWIKATDERIKTLINFGYSDIYVIGHSMGGVIACVMASKHPEVKKVVLAAPAFKYIAEKENFNLKKANSIINEYGIEELTYRFFSKLPPSAMLEFAELVKKHQNAPKNISVPILILQGTKDHVVPVTSSEYVFDQVQSKEKSLIYLTKSNHDIFIGPQKGQVNIKIEKFLLHGKIASDKEYI